MENEDRLWRRSRRVLSRRSILQRTVAAAGLVAAGCGGRAKTSAGVSPPVAPGSSPADSGLKPGNFKTGGTLQLQNNSVAGLDPYYSSSGQTDFAIGHVYSRLFRFVASTDPSVFTSHDLAPDLVDSYEISPDALTYTMKLRKNVIFHPPLGRVLTTADVLASWRKLTTDPRSVNADAFKPVVDSLTAPDDQTLVFKLKAPYASFLRKLANASYFWIQSSDAIDGKIDSAKQVVGTGPWMLVNALPTAYVYKKNPDYYIKGIPYADGAVLNILLDYGAREAQFQAGKIDVDTVPVVDVESIQKALPKAHVVHYNDLLQSFIFFSSVTAPDSPFRDIRVRRAVSLAIDRKGLLDIGYNGQGAWANLVIPGLGKWWLDPQSKESGDSGKWFKHDLAQARQLLEAAGRANIELKWMYPNNSFGEPFNTLADATRGMLADAGFKLTVVTLDYNKDYINAGEGIFFKGAPPNSMVYGLGPGRYPDADEYLSGMLLHDGTRNLSKVNDPTLEAMVHKEQAELDEAKRLILVKDIQRAHAEQMYYVPVVGQVRYEFYQPWIDNPIVSDEFSNGLERNAYLSTSQA